MDSTGVVGNDVTLSCKANDVSGVIYWSHNGTNVTVREIKRFSAK